LLLPRSHRSVCLEAAAFAELDRKNMLHKTAGGRAIISARRASGEKASPLKPKMSAYSRGQRKGAMTWKNVPLRLLPCGFAFIRLLLPVCLCLVASEALIQASIPYVQNGWGLTSIAAQLTKDGYTTYNVHHAGAGNAVGGGEVPPSFRSFVLARGSMLSFVRC
jgi:hypothetical protein